MKIHSSARRALAGGRVACLIERMATVRSPTRALVLAFAAVTASFVAASAYSQSRASAIDQAASEIATNASPSIEALAETRADLGEIQLRLFGQMRAVELGAALDRTEMRDARANLAAHVQRYLDQRTFLGENIMQVRIQHAMQRLDEAIDGVLDALMRRDFEEARNVRTFDVRRALREASDAIRDATSFNAQHAAALARQIEASRGASTRIALWLNVFCAIAALFATLAIARVVQSYSRVVEARNALLSQITEELDAFSSRVAHDIVGPLSSIAASVDLATEMTTDSAVTSVLARARRGVERTNRIVRDLLAFARSTVRVDGATANLRSVVADVLDELADEARNAGVTVSADNVPASEVACAPGVLMSIVANLARNAIRHMEDSGERRVTIQAAQRGAEVVLDVVDTGPGIPPELRDLVFLPHVRASNGAEGFGLGLATVKRLVEAHGGRVTLSEPSSGGAAFSIRLPAPRSDVGTALAHTGDHLI